MKKGLQISPSRRVCRWLLTAAVLLLGCTQREDRPPVVSPTDTANSAAAAEVVDEAWHSIYLHGNKVGYGWFRIESVAAPEGQRIRSSARQVLTLKREGQPVEETMAYRTETTIAGTVLSLASEVPSLSLASEGEVRHGMLKLSTTTAGKHSSVSMPWDDARLGHFGVEQSLRSRPMQPGEVRQLAWLQPFINAVTEERLEAVDWEETDLPGERRRLLKIKSEARFAGQSVRSTYWADEQGRLWRASQPHMGQEIYRTTEQLAKAPSDHNFDLVLSTIVKVDPPLENPHDTTRVVYRARLKHGNPAEFFTTCGSQSVRPLDEHAAEITVRRVTAGDPEQLETPCAPPVAGDSSPSELIQSDDPAVQALARSVAENESDPALVAAALERAVHQKITKKNYSRTFLTAAEAARSLEGDCTEHAVLLAAACRARGIPARVAGGLVYYPKQQGFAYHMWSEAWLAGRWVPLDATLGRGAVGGAHLKLFDSNLEGVGALAALLPVMNVMGQLELEIVEAQ